jgi:hypothetical protein
MKWLSYETVENEDGNMKSSNELREHVGSPSMFLDSFTRVFDQYRYHYLVTKVQKKAYADQERNLMPGQALIDVDFAENFQWEVRDAIQSAYYVTKICTLFIGISQYLDKETWSATSGDLNEGQEVTVMSSATEKAVCWAIVLEDYVEGEHVRVRVLRANGDKEWVRRALVRQRKIITKAHCVVSDDDKHDTWFVQRALEDIRGALNGKGITRWMLRSDGAASHFKQRFSIHFLKAFAKSSNLEAISWDFGAPGHGKGPWDGLAGTIKRNRIFELELTLVNAHEVFKHIHEYFGTETWAQHQKKTRGSKIKDMTVTWLPKDVVNHTPGYDVGAVICPETRIGTRLAFCFKLCCFET